MRFRHRRTASAGALVAAVVLGLSSCSVVLGEEESLLDATSLTVGVKGDQPKLGLKNDDGEFEGFDVDVAYYIAEKLGFSKEEVDIVEVTSANREEKLLGEDKDKDKGKDEKVNMVVATYSITPERKTEVTFGGPYYVAKQDVLVRAEDTHIQGVRDLEGLTVCQGEESNSAARITEGLGIDIEQMNAPDYSSCIDALREGNVDAVSTDNLILAGFLAEEPSAFRLVDQPFTDEKYGVGLPHGDVRACEAVNKAISQMYQDGTAQELLDEWFGETGLEAVTGEPAHVPQFEGCG
ncbi:glutamate ABC transporter substrate-binding protein [Nocardiopsis sp. ATB16-24]|uniref:glutamate ABC transporter substrate-binding protein n=1 Tax=Nocardiopsis sp. ATB16-24 TaxID=3019555 RepID=UPI002555CBA5|nr:glutamate ABC transporter substrate-binding protein [Nocardiopsis sp. ATB16-24]